MKFLNLCVVMLFLWSCNSGSSGGESAKNEEVAKTEESAKAEETKKAEKEKSQEEVAIDMDGPVLEMNVLSFSAENNKTEIEVINRSDEALTSVSLRLVFIGEDGAELTTATGRRKDSAFQMAKNRHVVGPKSRTVLTAMNKIEEGTYSMQIVEMKGTTKSGETITP